MILSIIYFVLFVWFFAGAAVWFLFEDWENKIKFKNNETIFRIICGPIIWILIFGFYIVDKIEN